MLRLTPPNNLKFIQATNLDVIYGGSEANVAVSLAQLGAKAGYVTRVPNNDLGKSALNELRKYGVETGPSVFGGDRLGVYFLEIDKSGGCQRKCEHLWYTGLGAGVRKGTRQGSLHPHRYFLYARFGRCPQIWL